MWHGEEFLVTEKITFDSTRSNASTMSAPSKSTGDFDSSSHIGNIGFFVHQSTVANHNVP